MLDTIHCQREFQTQVDFGRFSCDTYPPDSLIIADAILKLDIPHLAIHSPESIKSWQGVDIIIDHLINNHANRTTHLIAIGGGALLDLVGFVASIYMRGITWHAVPTTLLAMVDASIGGKTAINYNNTKNLLGSFYPPKSVLIDITYIQDQDLASGKAEVIKMLWTSSPEVMLPDKIDDLVKRAINLKLQIINNDWFEATGNRTILNAGHTFGHAFERIDLSLSHGQAVAYGLLAEQDLAEFLSGQDHQRNMLTDILSQQGLKTNYHYLLTDVESLIILMRKDKKSTNTLFKSTVAWSPGDSYTLSYTPDDVRRFVMSKSL
jgi:3-dehydroquinate synthase